MGWWGITLAQRRAVMQAVEGRVVHEFGAGDCTFADELSRLGARKVVAVEKEELRWPEMPRIRLVRQTFAEYAADYDAPFDVGVVCWPGNYDNPGLLALVERCKSVIYLGSNVDMTACGGKDLFIHFTCRPLVDYIPSRKNTLLVLGEFSLDRDLPVRLPTGEELAALLNWSGGRVFGYEESIAMCPHIDAFRKPE